jgi:hypothetical protein
MTGTLPRMVRMVNSPWDLLSSGGLEPAALKLDFAFERVDAIDGACEFGFAGAHQAVETNDLPRVDIE